MSNELGYSGIILKVDLSRKSSVPGKDGKREYKAASVVDKAEFEKMKDEYYTLRGRDPATGLQKKDSLQELGLEDLIGPLTDKVL